MSYKQTTKAAYDSNPDFYIKRFENPPSLKNTSAIDFFLKSLSGKKILDAGCGSGVFAIEFKKRGFDVVGIDISEPLLAYARSSGISAQNMDMEHITFAPLSFDGVWAMSSLLHIPRGKMRSVLASFHSILKSNGVLHVALKKGEGEKMVTDQTGSPRFFSLWTIEEFCTYTEGLFTLIFSEEVDTANAFIHMTFKKS